MLQKVLALLHTDELGNGLGRGRGVGQRDEMMSILRKYLIILIDQPCRMSITKDLAAK